MKIKKFQIKNYKSIIDSGECYPAELITIFAGKNESGKSSLLEALNDFNDGKKIDEKVIPIENGTLKPEIIIWFTASKEEISAILVDAEIEYLGSIPDKSELKITKKMEGGYLIDSEFQKTIPPDIHPGDVDAIKKLYGKLSVEPLTSAFNAAGKPLPVFDEENISNSKNQFIQWSGTISPEILTIVQATSKTNVEEEIEGIKKAFGPIPDLAPSKKPVQRFINLIPPLIPNFILFNSFEDIFPNSIPLGELNSNPWIKDLTAITNLDISIIQGGNDRLKVTHQTKINGEINSDFQKFWNQDISNLHLEYNSEKVKFWIQENDQFYEPEIRSQGRRWHLAFYIKVSARAKEQKNNIILIDEPGLYLHANAQRDILKNLEECAKLAPVMFSTHSPYLIEEDKLERVRLVQKDAIRGTVVENKIHKVADSETLTPILTAIGLELNRGIVSVGRKSNVVVEGISDYYYLNAFKDILSRNDLNYIHGGSSGNMPKIGTILQGWGCQVLYLYDNDRAFKDAKINIKKEWLAITKELLAKIPVDGAIEDMFTANDFARHILGVPIENHTIKNSEAAKNADKVLKAKHFRETIAKGEVIDIDDITKNNFNKLFDELGTMMVSLI